MIAMNLTNTLIKKYPNLGYSQVDTIKDYITEQVKNHNHGRQFTYYELQQKLGYPIEWLQLLINGGHNGFTLSEEDIKEIKA